MSFVKRTYTDQQTVITAQNLNDIQDELISQGNQLDRKIVVVNIAAYSGTTLRVPSSGTNSNITADHEVLMCTLGTPSVQTGDWTVNTYAGYLP